MMDQVNVLLAEQRLRVKEGTLVDATLIAARHPLRTKPSSLIPRCLRPRRATTGILK